MSRICGEWSESRAEASERINAALRHMLTREHDRQAVEDRPARQYSLREIADYAGCDPCTILRIERAALATIREKSVESETA